MTGRIVNDAGEEEKLTIPNARFLGYLDGKIGLGMNADRIKGDTHKQAYIRAYRKAAK